jgi:NAD(P)-dependent dehydrogenase (short-subunit alcohol dehydrogenase family)
MARFEGRVALVSGAASGIGAAVAVRLAEEGATVIRGDITEMPDGVLCDVTDPDSCRAAVDKALSDHGRLDVLVNVAGIGVARRIGEVSLEEWRRVIDVNLTGTFLLSQAALAPLLEARGPSSTWPRWRECGPLPITPPIAHPREG